jgi:hypothetical protein
MITVEVLGHEIEVGFIDGVAVSHNGLSFSGTHRIDFIDSNTVTFHVERVGKKITVSATSSGGTGGGGLNATVSGGVELVPDANPDQPGNITMGSVLIRDVLIPGAGFGSQWGSDDSPIGFFSWVGSNWSALWNATSLYFKSAAGFGFEGEGSTSPAWFNNLAGVVIGGTTMNGSSILQLISNTKAFLINVVSSLAGVNAPAQGMIVGSVEKDDLMLYWNNVWTGITRPEIFVIDDQNLVLEERHRNAVIVMTYNGITSVTPELGLSKGWTAFFYKKDGTNDYIDIVEGPYQEINAFNMRVYVGGAAIIHQGSEVFLVSGSLGPLVSQSAITAAIAAAEAAAKAYADDLQRIQVACSDETTAITAGTGKVAFRMPYAATLVGVRASLTTAQASGNIFTVDINEGGTSVLSTKLTIDNTEKTSTSAVTPAVISDAALADDAEITIDVDQIGTSGAAGLKVTLIFG